MTMRHPETGHDAYALLPANLQSGMRAWIEHGRRPGHFLTAVLEDRCSAAVLRADPVTVHYLPLIVRWIYNEAPSPCWGSPEKMAEWEDLCRRDPFCLCTHVFSGHRRDGTCWTVDCACRLFDPIPRPSGPCQRCLGPYEFDTSLSDERWAAIIGDGGAGRFCLTCIVAAAVARGESFDAAIIYGDARPSETIRVTVL